MQAESLAISSQVTSVRCRVAWLTLKSKFKLALKLADLKSVSIQAGSSILGVDNQVN